MFIPTYGILLLIRLFAVIRKYTVLDEQRREAKEGKSQRKNPRSITRGAIYDVAISKPFGKNRLYGSMGNKTDKQSIAIYRIPGPPIPVLFTGECRYNSYMFKWD